MMNDDVAIYNFLLNISKGVFCAMNLLVTLPYKISFFWFILYQNITCPISDVLFGKLSLTAENRLIINNDGNLLT